MRKENNNQMILENDYFDLKSSALELGSDLSFDFGFTNFRNISTNSGVEYTLISSCFLKPSSLDQIAQPRCSANAKYGISFRWGANFSALDCVSSVNLYIGNISILSLRISSSFLTSDSEIAQILAIVPIFLLNSPIKYGKATNFNLPSKNKSFVLPLPIMAANKTVASTTNSIYHSSRNLFATDSEILSVKSLATSSEILILDEIFLSLFNFSALSNIALAATSSQFTLNSSISSFSSLDKGTLNSDSAIFTSPKYNNENDYLNVAEKDIIAHNINIDGNVGIGTTGTRAGARGEVRV